MIFEFLVGIVVIGAVIGLLAGAFSGLSERQNPIKSAAVGAGAGAAVGLQQGCGCIAPLVLLGIAIAVGRAILG